MTLNWSSKSRKHHCRLPNCDQSERTRGIYSFVKNIITEIVDNSRKFVCTLVFMNNFLLYTQIKLIIIHKKNQMFIIDLYWVNYKWSHEINFQSMKKLAWISKKKKKNRKKRKVIRINRNSKLIIEKIIIKFY